MITIQTNGVQVRESLLSMLADLADIDKILNRATFDSFVMIKQRIQQRGNKTDNTPIGQYQGTPANPVRRKTKNGTTTVTAIAGYAKIRQDAGRQIKQIDLTFTGDMLDRSFNVIEIDRNTLAIGFLDDTNGDKARWLEKRFGKIFENSTEEIADFFDTVLQEVNNIINAS